MTAAAGEIGSLFISGVPSLVGAAGAMQQGGSDAAYQSPNARPPDPQSDIGHGNAASTSKAAKSPSPKRRARENTRTSPGLRS